MDGRASLIFPIKAIVSFVGWPAVAPTACLAPPHVRCATAFVADLIETA